MSETKEETQGPNHPRGGRPQPPDRVAGRSPAAPRSVAGSSRKAPDGRAAASRFSAPGRPSDAAPLGCAVRDPASPRRVPGRRVWGHEACVGSSQRARRARCWGVTGAGWGGVGEPGPLSEPS